MNESNQLDIFKESVKRERIERDNALDRLEVSRSYLINLARDFAEKLELAKGRVTSSEVLFLLRSQVPEMVQNVDPRFMGAVFRKGWERIGFEATGSHCRPVSIWRRKVAA